MNGEYDKYYQTEHLFGEPYPELMAFYSSIQVKGKLLDLGCGQGRDSIALAKLGYEVTGIDHSKVGIEQLNRIAEKENLPLKGIIGDIYEYSNFDEYEFLLLDSIFHFGKRERSKESKFIKKVIEKSKPNTLITICIQNTGKKLDILNAIIAELENVTLVSENGLLYRFEDKESNHSSETKYEMITIRKTN